MLQINIYRLLAFCAVALVLLDLLVITKLNVVRLYPLFPANFYFSYGSIIPYALMAFIMMVASWRIAITPFIYVVLACEDEINITLGPDCETEITVALSRRSGLP